MNEIECDLMSFNALECARKYSLKPRENLAKMRKLKKKEK